MPVDIEDPSGKAQLPLHPLGWSLTRLQRITSTMRVLSIYIFMITLINLILLLLSITPVIFHLPMFSMPLVLIINLSLSLLLIVTYDLRRRSGDALFEEISDELQWTVLKKEVEGEASSIKIATPSFRGSTPPIAMRITLREYVRTTNLPLVPGQYGPGFYSLVNLLLIICALVSVALRTPKGYW